MRRTSYIRAFLIVCWKTFRSRVCVTKNLQRDYPYPVVEELTTLLSKDTPSRIQLEPWFDPQGWISEFRYTDQLLLFHSFSYLKQKQNPFQRHKVHIEGQQLLARFESLISTFQRTHKHLLRRSTIPLIDKLLSNLNSLVQARLRPFVWCLVLFVHKIATVYTDVGCPSDK